MIYLQRRPHPALRSFIRLLWYTFDPAPIHRRERVLPTGCAQMVISLARDYLTDANHSANPYEHSAPAIFLGVYSTHQCIDTFDFAELMGIAFQPAGTRAFFADDAYLFTDREMALGDLWGNSVDRLRSGLQEAPTVEEKFATLEAALMQRLEQARHTRRNSVVDFALNRLHRDPVTPTLAVLTAEIGLSSRRVSQLFRENVGVSPKLYLRIRRFQRTVSEMHRSAEIRWAQLALDCGYYDHSHFANDFRDFSGINPTTYRSATRRWSNHVPIE